MEKENFDEELKNRIKQVFEEYDDGAATKGWDLLREKYPEKNRRKYFFWWFAAALFFIAFIFWLLQPDFNQNKVTKAVKQHATDSAATLTDRDSSAKKSVNNKVFSDTGRTQKISVKTTSGFMNKLLPDKNKIVQQRISTDTISTEKTPVKTVSGFVSKQLAAKNKISKQSFTTFTLNTKKTPVKTASGFIAKSASTKNKQATLAINRQELQPKPEAEDQKNASFTGKKSMSDSIVSQTKTIIPASTDPSKQKTLAIAAKKTDTPVVKPTAVKKAVKTETIRKSAEKPALFSLGLFAGTHLNYAKGSNNQLGLGAGISTDFRLSKNFKIATGLGLIQNNLTYSQNIPGGSLLAANSNYAASPSTGVIIQNPGLSSINARLVALDIPLNLTYTFLPGKNSISVSAGISSNTFVKEAYGYHYSNLTSSTQTIKSFNNFDFAKTLNLSAGFAYPLGKNNLQIEPFLKYPLGGNGSQQLKFGSAGIILKMNLQTGKNKSGKYF